MRWLIILGVVIMMIPNVQGITTERYDYSEHEICTDGVCELTIYGGIKFVKEKGEWIEKTKARSLKESEIFKITIKEDDKIHGIEVVDFNYSCATIKPYAEDITKFEYDTNIPVKIDGTIEGYIKIPGVLSPLTEVTICDETIIEKEISFGKESTTISISGTTNNIDTMVREQYPTSN